MHSADHQHMGKPRAPVGVRSSERWVRSPTMAASTPAGPDAIPAAGRALSRFWSGPSGRGSEVLCPSSAKPFSISRVQGNAVGIGGPVSIRVLPAQRARDPLPGLHSGSWRTPPGSPASPSTFPPTGTASPARIKGRPVLSTSAVSRTRAPGVGGLQILPAGRRVQHRQGPAQPQQQADAASLRAHRASTAAANGNKKCRKRRKSPVCGKKAHTNSTPSIPAQKTQSGRRIAA